MQTGQDVVNCTDLAYYLMKAIEEPAGAPVEVTQPLGGKAGPGKAFRSGHCHIATTFSKACNASSIPATLHALHSFPSKSQTRICFS